MVAPKWLANAALFYRPLADVYVGARWNHVGDRAAGDGYDTIDVTLSKQNVLVAGLDLRGGVKNALDDDVVYLSPRPGGGITEAAFPGRAMWVQLSWRR